MQFLLYRILRRVGGLSLIFWCRQWSKKLNHYKLVFGPMFLARPNHSLSRLAIVLSKWESSTYTSLRNVSLRSVSFALISSSRLLMLVPLALIFKVKFCLHCWVNYCAVVNMPTLFIVFIILKYEATSSAIVTWPKRPPLRNAANFISADRCVDYLPSCSLPPLVYSDLSWFNKASSF